MRKKQRLCLAVIMVLAFMMIAQILPVFADETATAETAETAEMTYAPYKVSNNKLEGEAYNNTNANMFFGKYEKSYCFFLRVPQESFTQYFGETTEIKDKAAFEFLYRIHDESNDEDEKWLSGNAAVLHNENITDGGNEEGEKFVYLVLDTYSGGTGMRDLKVGNEYDLVFNFYKKTETAERELTCSTDIITVKYDNSMYVSWKEYFSSAAGVSLDSDGKIAASGFDLFDVIKVPMGFLLSLFYKLIPNYLVAIFLFALVIKIILLFVTGIKQQKNMVKQAKFAPKQAAIQKKYKGRTDQKTLNEMRQEITQAQQESGINPMGGGCLGMLLQMLILICLYNVIRYPLTYLNNVPTGAMSMIKQYFTVFTGNTYDDITIVRPLTENFGAVSEFLKNNFSFNLSDYVTAESLPDFMLFNGFDMAGTPSISNINILIIVPIFVFLSYYFSMKLTKKMSYQQPKIEGTPDAGNSMKILDIAMPALSTFICFSVPALLGIYWIFSSLLGILQQYVLKKIYPFPVFTEDDYKAAEREYKGKQPKADERREALSKKSRYDDDGEDYAVLDDKKSYYDMTDEEKRKEDEKTGKSGPKTDNNTKKSGKYIGKAEMNDTDDKNENK